MLKKQTVFLITLTSVAATTAIIAAIAGCGGGNNNPGGGDKFAMYTLTTDVKPKNCGTLSRDPHATTYQNGTEVTLTATPAANYRFAGWSDTSLLQVTPLTITMTRNINLTANFVPISTPDGYVLTTKSDPDVSAGTVRRSPDQTHYPAGTEVRLTAEAEPDYTFIGWVGSGAPDSTAKSIIITMNGDREVTAKFLPNVYRLTTGDSPPGSGTVTREPDQEIYAHGARVTVKAEAKPGYVFTRWTDPTVPARDSITITMTGDRVLTALFSKITTDHHTLTIHLNPTDGSGGKVERSPDKTAYTFGDTVIVKASPNQGYRFLGWTGDLTSPKAIDTVTITGDMTITAQFQQVRTLTINRIPENGGSVTPESGAGHDINNPVVNIEATPASGYKFDGWTVTNGTATIADTSSAKTTINLSSNATTINAKFQRTFILTIDQNPAGSAASITPASGLSCDSGAAVNIRAIPAKGYWFAGWTVTNGTATIDSDYWSEWVSLSTNATITANFQQPIPGSFTDSRDGRTYRTVKINNLTWMAENLNYATTDGSWCYDDADSNCVKYGRLYSWGTAMSACPAGWSGPGRDNWNSLFWVVGGRDVAGRKLKSENGWNGGGNGTDEFGFSALPGGARLSSMGGFYGVSFNNIGNYGRWWTGDSMDTWGMSYDSDVVGTGGSDGWWGHSVRCVQDIER